MFRKMATSHDLLSSDIKVNFSVNNIDRNTIQPFIDGNQLVHDGTKFKWVNDFVSLKNFIENIVGLTGKWRSPGGNVKKFNCTNADLFATWYQGKKNSLLFQGKDGELFKNHLVGLLNSTNACVNNDNANNFHGCSTDSPATLVPEKANLFPARACELVLDNNVGNNLNYHECISCCMCSCSDGLIEDMKINMEILQSRVDALQTLANTQQLVFTPVVDQSHRIEELERVLAGEKKRTNQLETEIVLLKGKLTKFDQKCIINDKCIPIFSVPSRDGSEADQHIITNNLPVIAPNSTTETADTITDNSPTIIDNNIIEIVDDRVSEVAHHIITNNPSVAADNNTIVIADERVPEIIQQSITSISPAIINEIAEIRVSDAEKHITTYNTLTTVNNNNIFETDENICNQPSLKKTRKVSFRKNPFPKNQFRSRPPSYLHRPTEEWLNHLELVHQVTKPIKHFRDDQFLSELQLDLSKNIAFLPLIGLCRF